MLHTDHLEVLLSIEFRWTENIGRLSLRKRPKGAQARNEQTMVARPPQQITNHRDRRDEQPCHNINPSPN